LGINGVRKGEIMIDIEKIKLMAVNGICDYKSCFASCPLYENGCSENGSDEFDGSVQRSAIHCIDIVEELDKSVECHLSNLTKTDLNNEGFRLDQMALIQLIDSDYEILDYYSLLDLFKKYECL
jgi:hypothetical protein